MVSSGQLRRVLARSVVAGEVRYGAVSQGKVGRALARQGEDALQKQKGENIDGLQEILLEKQY